MKRERQQGYCCYQAIARFGRWASARAFFCQLTAEARLVRVDSDASTPTHRVIVPLTVREILDETIAQKLV